MRTLRITVELSRSPRRMWLKAVDNTGFALVVANIDASMAVRERNKLLERLTASGEFDEIVADPIPKRGRAPRLGPRADLKEKK